MVALAPGRSCTTSDAAMGRSPLQAGSVGTMVRRVDLLVAGAGPAGIAAAITAVERGLDVVVVDSATFPRDKTCGDGLTAGALRLLEGLGFPRAALGTATYASVHEAMIVSPSGRRVALPIAADGDHAGVVARIDLDAAFVEHARTRGVQVCEGNAVEQLTRVPLGVRVTTAHGEDCVARFVVAADGHFSSVRRAWQPDAGPALGEWHAARQYFSGVRDRRLWVAFEEDLLPGYAWVFPLPGDRANVGFGVLRDGRKGHELKELWGDILQRPLVREILGADALPEDRVRAWPIPTRYDPTSLADGRVLFAGDAAGVVDPMTGEGIAQAIETGMLASRRRSSGCSRDRRRHGARSAPSTRTTGRAATSPAGCSRTTRVLRSSLRAAGTASSSPQWARTRPT